MTQVIQDEARNDVEPHWYVVQAKPRQADRAENNLVRQGYSVYHPKVQVEHVRRGRRCLVEESLFPNYLFIRLHRWLDNWYPLRSTRGVSRLLSFGGEPLAVADDLIESIRCRASQVAIAPILNPGDRIQIVDGPFSGVEAIFETQRGEDRVRLLIEILHRQVAVTVPVESIRRRA